MTVHVRPFAHCTTKIPSISIKRRPSHLQHLLSSARTISGREREVDALHCRPCECAGGCDQTLYWVERSWGEVRKRELHAITLSLLDWLDDIRIGITSGSHREFKSDVPNTRKRPSTKLVNSHFNNSPSTSSVLPRAHSPSIMSAETPSTGLHPSEVPHRRCEPPCSHSHHLDPPTNPLLPFPLTPQSTP